MKKILLIILALVFLFVLTSKQGQNETKEPEVYILQGRFGTPFENTTNLSEELP